MKKEQNQKQEFKVRRRWVTEKGTFNAGESVFLTQNEALLNKDFLCEKKQSSNQTEQGEKAQTQGQELDTDLDSDLENKELKNEVVESEQKEAAQNPIASAFGSVANKIFGGSASPEVAPQVETGDDLETKPEPEANDVLDS